MNNETRILIVEDLVTDYELARREIGKVVKQCSFERAVQQRDFLNALEKFRPDLILSDYKLPGFDGMKVLKLAQKLLPSVPVIIWTGTMGESVAVDCLKEGASNYLLKDDMKRLGPAVLRALEERNLLLENKRVEEKYQTIFENALEGIFQSTLSGRYLSVNPAMARIYGYASPAEMLDLVTDISRQIYTEPCSHDQFIELLLENDRIKNFEMKNLRKDGSVIWTSASARAVRDENGSIVYFEGFLQDITERKQIENAEREQCLLTEALRHTAESLNSTLEYGEVLDQILATVGNVVPSDAATIMLIDEGLAHVVRSRGYKERGLKAEVMELELSLAETANLRKMLETGKPLIVADTDSFPNWKKSPANEWIRSNVGAPISLRGRVIGFILLDSGTPGFFTPLHAEHLEAFSHQAALAIHNSRLLQQAQEEVTARTRTDDALRESEERFRLIAQNAEDLIWTMNMEFQVTYVSPAVERALGCSAEEILTSTPEQFLTFESFSAGLNAFTEEVENARRQPDPNYARLLEMEYRRKDGSTFCVETKFSFFRDSNGYPTTVLGVGRDITERKRMEAQARDLLEFNGKILNHSPLGILTYKLTGECVFANEIATSIIDARMEDLISQNFHTLSSWKDSGLYELAKRAISTHSLATADVHHTSTYGKELWLRAHFVPFRSKEEDHLLLAITDITDRKLAEDKLRESEKRLILALSAAQMSVWEWDARTNNVIWSPEFYEIAGIEESDFDGSFESYTGLIHPQDVDRVRKAADLAVTGNTMFAEEFRILRPDGEVQWLSSLGHAEYDQSGTSLRMIGTIQDITWRKQVEIERQALLEIMQGLTSTGNLQDFLELIHRSIGNVIYAENFFVVVHNQDTSLFEEIYSVDQHDPPASPSRLEKSITSYVFRTGEPILLDKQLFAELSARGEVELIGTDSASWLGAPLRTPNGTIGVIAVQDYENPNRYAENDKNFLASIAAQVALAFERKQIEEKVRRSEERYRALFENSPISIWEEDFSQVKKYLDSLKQQGLTDFPSYFAAHPEVVTECTKLISVLDVNHAGLHMYWAKSKEELIESTIQAPCQGEQEHNAEDFLAIAEGRTSNEWEGEDETLTGEPIEINLRWSVAPGHEQDFSRVIVTVIDITQRKQAEEEIRKQTQMRIALYETTHDLVIERDLSNLLKIIVERVARLLNTGGGGLYLCEPELDQVRCLVSYNTPLDFTGTVLKYGEGAAGLVAETGLPLMIDDYSTWAGHAEVYNGEKYFNAVISVPIKWQDEVIGVIHALAYDDRRFNENDLNLMLSFANQAAIAIHNVRLYTLSQQELAERKRISDALQTAEEKYRRLVEQVPAAIYIDTGDDYGTKTYISPQIEKISGYPAQAWIMDPLLWSKAIHPEDRERVLAENIRTNRTGEMFDIEYRLVQSTGQITWVREEAVLIHAPDDGTPVWHGMIADIAERKQTEEALRESEERFSNAFEFAPIGKALVSLDGRWLKVNQALCTLIGYSKEEMISKTFQEITHPEDLETDLSYVNQMLAGQIVSYQMEKRYIHKSGDIVWVLLSVSLVKERDGKPLYFISQIQDVTQRKNAEQEISRRAKETSALLETSLALTNLDLKAILQDIGNSAKNLFAADGCRIFLMQPDGESLRCVLALQESPEAFLHLIVKPGQGVTGAVAASGQAEIVNEMQNDPRAVPVPGTDEEDEALMFAPLKERDRTIGVLSIRRNGIDRPFQPDDLEFLEAFASMAASAVSNARLFEETQRRLAELEALYENGLAVSQLLEPHQIGDRIIETFSRHLSWHHVAIRLLNPGMDELMLIAFNQPGMKMEGKKEIEHRFNSLINRVGQGMSGLVVQTGQSIRTGNVEEYPQFVNTYPGIKSGMYMPLRVGEHVIGVISVESEEPDALTAQDERLLATLANQAAIAFENARLYQAAQQEITERKLVEEELRESQERYRLLIETSPDGIIMMNMDGTIRFSNQQMAGLFTFETPAELLGINFTSLFTPQEHADLEQHAAGPIVDDKSQEGHWLIRKDGSSFFGELRSSALRNEKGEQYAIIAQLRDVTERNHSQEALREERQRFLDLFENSPIPTWLEDFTAVAAWMDELRAHGVINLREFLEQNPDEYRVGVSLINVLDVNHAAVIMNGAHNRQELLHTMPELMLDKTPFPIMIHEFDMIWQGNTSFGFEMSSSKLDGSLISGILHIYIPVNNGQPDYTRVIVTSTVITERVEIEKRLRASELHYRELADSITDVLFELDHDLRYTHWNKASEMLMEIPANKAIGKSMYEIFGESEEQTRIGKIYRSVLEENQPQTFETELLLHDQRLVFEINANPSTHGVSVVARNITERKLSETLMQKRFELVEYAAHHTFKDVLQKTIDVASELTGSHIGFLHFIEEDQTTIKLQAWSTETLDDFCKAQGEGLHYPLDQAGVWADAIRHRRSMIHNHYESLSDRKGIPVGHGRVTREMVIPIVRNERIVAVIGLGNKIQEYTPQNVETAERFVDYAWDITERKQMESALAEERNQLAKRVEERTADLSRANSNLARALRVKDEFLANMSHELRTPLNAILGLSESLGEQVAGPLNEKQQKYLSTINESGHHLLALINDILDLAKIEAGQITLDINKVDVNSVCQASLRMVKQLAQKKNQEVLFEIDSDLGLMWADERRLKQMIVNLLSNAVKFTPEYSRIGLEVHGDRAANKVVITVWDTGIGIREEDLERLFKPFVQLDSGLAREATGTGLGLALVAQMARLHGGSVHALSSPGEGSRFIIQLPWEPAMASDMVAHLRSTGKFRAIDPSAYRPTVLLIEDTREVLMILVDYLEMAGYKMVTAQDGVDGLEQAKLTHPDLILMDIQMPRMDGFEATQKLRNDPEFRNTPIIALTALAMPNDRQRCLDAGMNEYISKPVNLKALTKTIQKLLSPDTGVA